MAWIAALVAAGTAYYSSQQQKKANKKGSDLQSLLAGNIRETSPTGINALNSGIGDLNAGEDFWRRIAVGDRASTMSLLAPQIEQDDATQRNAWNQSAMLNPRGGGSPEGRLSVMDNALARRNNAVMALRPAAYNALGTIGAQKANIGTSLLSGNASGGSSLLNYGLNQNAQNFAQDSATGQSIYNILKLLKSNKTTDTTGTKSPSSTGGAADDFGGFI